MNRPFRKWLHDMWLNHQDEQIEWNQPSPKYDEAFYIQKYKWWLKREYKHQRKQHGK